MRMSSRCPDTPSLLHASTPLAFIQISVARSRGMLTCAAYLRHFSISVAPGFWNSRYSACSMRSTVRMIPLSLSIASTETQSPPMLWKCLMPLLSSLAQYDLTILSAAQCMGESESCAVRKLGSRAGLRRRIRHRHSDIDPLLKLCCSVYLQCPKLISLKQ